MAACGARRVPHLEQRARVPWSTAGVELGHVVPDVERAELRRQPTPALHVALSCTWRSSASALTQRLTELLELRVLRVERPEIGVGRVGCRDLRQHGFGRGYSPLVDGLMRDGWRPPRARSGHLSRSPARELDLGVCLLLDANQLGLRARRIEGARIEAPILICVLDLVASQACAFATALFPSPKAEARYARRRRLATRRSVTLGERGDGELLADRGDDRVRRGRRRQFLHDFRRRLPVPGISAGED